MTLRPPTLHLWGASACCALLLAASAAQAHPPDIVAVGGGTAFTDTPAINASGTIVYTTTTPGVFVSEVGAMPPPSNLASGLTGFTRFVSPAINDQGDVGFFAEGATSKIFLSTGGGAPTEAASTDGGFNSLFPPVGVDDNGAIYFVGSRTAGGGGAETGIFSVVPGNDPVLEIDAARFTFDSFAVNGAGEIAFAGVDNDAGPPQLGVFSSSDLSMPITTDADGQPLVDVSPTVSINDQGVVAFAARTTAGLSAIFSGVGGEAPREVASQADGYADFGTVAIDDNGIVAFEAATPSGQGVFAGPNPAGDLLFGSSDSLDQVNVQEVLLAPGGAGNGQYAFLTTLTNGTAAIGRDAVPEPTGLVIAGLGLLAAALRRR